MNAPLHILMLEDDPTDAEIIRRSLLAAFTNALIDLATDKDEYIELLNNRQPDVIVADNSLPQFTATEALVILHQRSLRIPFILVTGTVSEEFAAGIIKMGASDYILKDRLGKGFDKKKKKNGIGLSNILSRVELYNGSMQIEASPGKGCALNIHIPEAALST